jgi:TRAP-type C4-dicarboxylate transport system substrate-binding protein
MPFLHLVNARKFESLPEETRHALLEAAKVAEQKFATTYDEAFDSIRVAQQAAGYTVTEISSADLAKWENNEALGRLQSEWIRESEAAGLDNAAEIMEKVRAIHREAMHR